MQIGFGVGVAAGGAAVKQPQMAVLGGEFSQAQAELDLQDHVTAVSENVQQTTGAVVAQSAGAAQTASMAGLAPVSGAHWVSMTVDGPTPATFKPRFLSPTHQPLGTRNRTGQHVFAFDNVPDCTQFQLVFGSTFDGQVINCQLHDMAAILAQPADIYVAWGQSNMAATQASLGVDPALDYWPDTRAFYIPGYSYSAFGSVVGTLAACVAPLQMNAISNGVSPAMAFVQNILPQTPQGRNVVLIAAAWSGSGLVGAGAAWNPAGTDPFAYDNMITLVSDALTTLPVGSQIKGVIGAQGESDRATDMDVTWPAAFAAMRSAAQAAWGTGELPWMLIAPPPDGDHVLQSLFEQTQIDMDQDSGHSLATTKLHVIARPFGFLEDGTHATAQGQRNAGRLAALRFLQLGYL